MFYVLKKLLQVTRMKGFRLFYDHPITIVAVHNHSSTTACLHGVCMCLFSDLWSDLIRDREMEYCFVRQNI